MVMSACIWPSIGRLVQKKVDYLFGFHSSNENSKNKIVFFDFYFFFFFFFGNQGIASAYGVASSLNALFATCQGLIKGL